MSDIAPSANRDLAMIPAMSANAIAKVRALEDALLEFPQVDIHTHHVIHAGMYARTICIPAGVMLTGALIKCATLLIFSGRARVTIGEQVFEMIGYSVLAAAAGRKQAFLAIEDTHLTMIFPTSAQTVEDAEAEFTDEADRLISRDPRNGNTVVITGD